MLVSGEAIAISERRDNTTKLKNVSSLEAITSGNIFKPAIELDNNHSSVRVLDVFKFYKLLKIYRITVV
ncbi:MAG: hypothetical protein V7K77_21220 [Nostoc sp.]|uniref:hypothetical protein n=1 Tax=Nostoc sp. TaxID=1180 RepID=UPI002FFB4D63